MHWIDDIGVRKEVKALENESGHVALCLSA